MKAAPHSHHLHDQIHTTGANTQPGCVGPRTIFDVHPPHTIMSPIPSFGHHHVSLPKSAPLPSSISTHPADAYLPPPRSALWNHVVWSQRPRPHLCCHSHQQA